MARHYQAQFDNSREMQASDFEIYYYEDKVLENVSMHRHDYYEIYFFLEGNLSYQIGKNVYPLSYGDICLIPPGVYHRPKFKNTDLPYRRIVLWLSPSYYNRLVAQNSDLAYGYNLGHEISCHHFPSNMSTAQMLFSKLVAIIEERNMDNPFKEATLDCDITSLMLAINRNIYMRHNKSNINKGKEQDTLFTRLCEYINANLDSDLSLDAIASTFYVSKYHISHIFKDNMGISLHQYLQKKRLEACKASILSGESFKDVAEAYGFTDYTSFFRAFKKEYGISPKEFKEANLISTQDSKEVTDTIEHAVFK